MFHKNLEVPEEYIGLVIGKRGKTLKKLECKHDVKIVFSQGKFNFYSEKSEKKITDAISSVVKIYCNKEECPICMENLDMSKNFATTPCGHKFHFDCLMKSVKTSKCCPLCRQQLMERKDSDIDSIILETILVMRRNNYWFYLYYYINDILDYQLVLENFLKEPLRYALSKVI